MNTKSLFSLKSIVLSCIALFPFLVLADGFIVIKPIEDEPARLNVKYHHVTISINNHIAITKVDQAFENPYDQDLEGTYLFPVPPQAQISKFTMNVNNEPLEAQIVEKDEARKTYESIVEKHKDPALLEYLDHGMIQARIYPIPAHGTTRISLEYSEILNINNGTVKYYYTLGTEKFSDKNLEDVSVAVNISAPKNILNIYSPTHTITTKQDSPTHASAVYQAKDIRPNQDFILYYTQPKDEVAFNVLTYKSGIDKEDGFFLAMLSPDYTKQQEIIDKEIVFVIDVSGSMSGEKIEQAKDALKYCLQHLNGQDKFNIVCFNSTISHYQKTLIPATKDNVAQALHYVNAITADGGTDINSALLESLKLFSNSEKPQMIVFLTDGEPTSGQTNISSIIKNTNAANAKRIRLFSFGIGHGVNTTLLDKISLDNKGTSDYVRPEENIESVITQFYKKVANPALSDLHITFSGTTVKEIFPVDLPDLFFGSQLVVVGRYTNGGSVTVHLSGKQNTTEKEYVFVTEFVQNNNDNNFLPRIWASRKIASYTDKMVLDGKNQELIDDIIKLSRKYGIMTPYTSFLLDVGADEFKTGLTAGKESALSSIKFAQYDQSSKASFNRASLQSKIRYASNYTEDDTNSVVDTREKMRTMRDRTFYQKDNIWYDADHTDASPIRKIQFMSKEYFELLKTMPELAAYLSLGNKIIVKTATESIFIDDTVPQKA